MDIILKDNRYYLQLSNGELELTEQQAKKRLERGDQLRDAFDYSPTDVQEPEVGQPLFSYTEQAAPPPPPPPPPTESFFEESLFDTPQQPAQSTASSPTQSAQAYISSGKYFDNLIKEFEQIYKYSEDKLEAVEKLTRFCKNAITKLHHDRRNPKSDHVVIDFYILSWTRVIAFLKSLATRTQQDEANAVAAAAAAMTPPVEAIINPQPRNLTRQLLIVQLLQADGLFPISDALQGITQADIINIISVMLHADKEAVQEAIQTSSAILLKRGISGDNIEERIHLLQDMEKYFEQLPYSNIISRIKLLIKIYYEMAAEK